MPLNQTKSYCLIDRILSGATTLGQNGLGSNGDEGVLCIPLLGKGVIPLSKDAVGDMP